MQILDKIHAFASQDDGKLAIAFNNRPVSYGDFYRGILSARRFLDAQGLAPGKVAVIWNENLLESWVLDLALRSLGLITASIQGLAEVGYFAANDVAALVTTYDQAARSGFHPGQSPLNAPVVLTPNDLLTDVPRGPLEPPPNDREDLGHLLMTSATTGAYKKVWQRPAISEDRIEKGIDEYRKRQVDVGQPGERILSLVDLGLWTATGYGPAVSMWITGNAVSLYQEAEPWRAFDYPGVSHAMVTPGFLYALMRAPVESLTYRPSLNVVVVGGAMSLKLARAVRERLTPRLVSTLGSTEGGMWAITPILGDEDLRFHKINPERILQVVDEDDRPVPPGTLGRLRVKIEAGGAQRYYDDEEATASFFRDGWFYPGDLAMARPDGRLSLHGRVTDIISVEGFKVAAEPLERSLQERLDVDAVCLFSIWGGEAEELHVVLQTGRQIAPQTLTEAISATLRGFPRAHIHYVDDIPRNHMGKVRRLALKQMLMTLAGVTFAPVTAPAED